MYQQNYGYYPQQQQTYLRNAISGGLKGRPVSSLDEAKASAIDFDGSIFYFPDLANKRIYTKQINVDGTSLLNMYELSEIPLEQPITNQQTFITREEFDRVIKELKDSLIPPQQQPSSQTPAIQQLNF